MATSELTRDLKQCESILNKIFHSAPGHSDSLAVIRKIIRCDECSPRQAAVCAVELRFFCVNHFVAYCHQRLEESEKALSGRESGESVRSFLRECATQAAKLLLIQRELQNVDRARLLDIILWANELFYQSISNPRTGARDRSPAHNFVAS